MVNKIWNKQDKCRVWLMEMPDAEKPKRTKRLSYRYEVIMCYE